MPSAMGSKESRFFIPNIRRYRISASLENVVNAAIILLLERGSSVVFAFTTYFVRMFVEPDLLFEVLFKNLFLGSESNEGALSVSTY